MRDLTSALRAYEASKKTLIGPNMYVYRAIIDTCGLCGDYEKSRYIYEVFPNQYTYYLFGLSFWGILSFIVHSEA